MAEHAVDVVIIGGGIVGLSVGLEVQARGRRVAIIDPDDLKAKASFGNAGVLSRGSIFAVAAPGLLQKIPRYLAGQDIGVRMRLGALPGYARWLARFLKAGNETDWRAAAAALNPMVERCFDRHVALADRVGARHMIKRNGWIRVYRHADGEAVTRLERALWAEHGVNVEILDRARIAELEPHLAPRFGSGLWFGDTGSVETPGELLTAYRTAFVNDGGLLLAGTARSLVETTASVTVRTESDAVVAQRAVLAAGAWSARFAKTLGYVIPLAAERGYHLHLRPRGNAHLNRPVYDAEGGYVMSPMGDTVRVLSGVELARLEDRPNYSQIETVVADASQSLALDPSPVHEVWMGNRPSTPDGLPVIGVAARHKRLVFAFGHGHIGFANGPITGQLVGQLIGGEPLSIPIGAFSPRRFGA